MEDEEWKMAVSWHGLILVKETKRLPFSCNADGYILVRFLDSWDWEEGEMK
jgi:hypothetical protein